MKKKLAVLIGVLAVLCLSSACADWLPYTSPYGFTMQYPEEMAVSVEYWEAAGINVECFSWQDDASAELFFFETLSDSVPDWEALGYVRQEIDEPDVELAVSMEMNYRVYSSLDRTATLEEVRLISAAGQQEVFVLNYPSAGIPVYRETMHAMLETLEFPPQNDQAGSFWLAFDCDDGYDMETVVVDEGAQPCYVYTDGSTVTDLVLEYLTWDDGSYRVIQAEPVYQADVFTGNDAIMVQTYYNDFFPPLRIRAFNDRGEEECWYFFVSGMDGSLLLLSEIEL